MRPKDDARRTAVGGAKSLLSISPDSLNLYNSPHGASSPKGAAAFAPAPLEAMAGALWLEAEARRVVKESERRTRPTVPATSPPALAAVGPRDSPGSVALPALRAVAAVSAVAAVIAGGRGPALSSAIGAGAWGSAGCGACAAAADDDAGGTGTTAATVAAGVVTSAGMVGPQLAPQLVPQSAAHGETDLRGAGGSQIRLTLPLISLLSLLPLAVTGCCNQKAGGGGGAVFGIEGTEDAQP
jgi:hypothetical protein